MTSGANRKRRVIPALLLALSLAAVSAASASAQGEESGRRNCVSGGEGCEAARLAVRFVKRMHETGDAAPLVEEFFLPDFAERFQKFLRDGNLKDDTDPLFVGVSRATLTAAAPEDLRRAFVALVNAWHHSGEFSDAVSDVTEARHNLVSVLAEDANWRLRAGVQRSALPPAFFETLNSDPMLALMLEFFEGDGAETNGNPNYDEDEGDALMMAKVKATSVQSVARLRSLTERVERCAALMRDAAERLRAELKAYPDRSPEREIDLDDVYRVETETYKRETLGFPPGTPFISARLFPYVIIMVPFKGQLKVIGVLPDFYGD